ncbi:M48 family peptidase [Seongchinamella unica]|uniref:M48 family peptidase n=1 Tax=Seongchinamella unica TaxID=2547392 RepID=A0A4R5LW36_9GAMM|nr:SprT family zinc-dependent metalloprotease [Seongchinamella unica]TDG15640.1 M48 family peptidase [Seongchinamella unica]
MQETITLGDIDILVTRKAIKNVHLSVHPPEGRVTLVAPVHTRLDVARAYAISKLGWIRKQQEDLRNQARETPRQYVSRESHYIWGKRYLLQVKYVDTRPGVKLDHKRVTLTVRPGASRGKREEVYTAWQRSLLHAAIPPLIHKWETKLGVEVSAYYLQRMRTKWGSCNHRTRNIRLNSELVKKPKDLLEYVLVHEMAHLIEPSHNQQFVALLDKHYPHWEEARTELNELPLST